MKLTIKDALKIHPFSEAKLVAGAGGLERTVTAVNIMDAPDIFKWIKKGELLFTTAYVMKDNPAEALHIIKKLNNKGCAGLGIKLGRYWKMIPEEIIEEANHLQFPIFELPYDYTFSDQIKAFYTDEFKKNTDWLKNTLNEQKKLITFPYQEMDMMSYLETVSNIIQHPLAIITTKGQVIFNKSEWTEIELLQDWYGLSETNKIQTDKGNCYRIPLLQDEQKFGYLLIITSKFRPISKDEEDFFYQVAEIVTHQLNSQQAESPDMVSDHKFGLLIERYLKEEISLDYVLNQLEPDQKELLTNPFQCVLTISNNHVSSNETLKQIRNELVQHPQLQAIDARHLVISGSMFSIFSYQDEKNQFVLSNDFIFTCLNEVLHAANQKENARMLISNRKEEANDLYDAYSECVDSKQIADELDYNQPVIMYENLEFISLFRHIPTQLIDKYYDNVLHLLTNNESDYEKEMLHTLEMYVNCDGNINKTAKRLFVHRNTVVYRLEKVSNLLNMDLKHTNDFLRLKLAFLFKQLKKTYLEPSL